MPISSIIAWLLVYLVGTVSPPGASDSAFSVRAKGVKITYDVFAITAMPGEAVRLDVASRAGETVRVAAQAGRVEALGQSGWQWIAPAGPGAYRIEIRNEASGGQILLNALVLEPSDHEADSLNGFRFDRYEAEPLRNNPVYERPKGFVRVTPEIADLPVSPHFKLGQFLCKQAGGWPKYLALRERILVKLEAVVDRLNERGMDGDAVTIMSAYRTPYYNRLIGNRTRYSRHLYGGAVDIYIDSDGDDWMDDLNGDGRIDKRDARVVYDVIRNLASEPGFGHLAGGLAIYGSTADRGPFVHMDVRGKKARW
jgi:hypothetical protein